jgi:prepilin-type processing-associated H-X9-DG protein
MVSRSVLAGKFAYVAMPPQLVAEPEVMDFTLSNGGGYALLQRLRYSALPELPTGRAAQPPTGMADFSLVLWDAEYRRSSMVWHADAAEASISQIAWLKGAEVAYVAVRRTMPAGGPPVPPGSEPAPQLLRIDPAAHRTETIDLSRYPKPDNIEINPSTIGPLVMIRLSRFSQDGPGSTSVLLLNSHGVVNAHADIPAGTYLIDTQWSDAGSPLLSVLEPQKGKKPTVAWLAMNPNTGQLIPTTAPAPPKLQAAPGASAVAAKPGAVPLQLKQSRTRIPGDETKSSIGLLWLMSAVPSDHPTALLSSDCSRGELLAHSLQVLYQTQHGAVWSVPLQQIDAAKYLAMKALADKLAAIQNAKQCGLALLMSAQDNGENLPSQGDLASSISPYLSDPSAMAGFVYTYPGGPLSDIDSPAETVIGYISSPGGRAVLYADGHVKWLQ